MKVRVKVALKTDGVDISGATAITSKESGKMEYQMDMAYKYRKMEIQKKVYGKIINIVVRLETNVEP